MFKKDVFISLFKLAFEVEIIDIEFDLFQKKSHVELCWYDSEKENLIFKTWIVYKPWVFRIRSI